MVMKIVNVKNRDYETSYAESTEALLNYIVYLYVELAKQVAVFKETIYVQKKLNPLVVEKTISDLNHFITLVYPYLPKELRNIKLEPNAEDIKKVVPIFNKISKILYDKGIIRVDTKLRYKTYDLFELFQEAVDKDTQRLRNEYKKVLAENEKLKLKVEALEKENASLRARVQELEAKLNETELKAEDATKDLLDSANLEDVIGGLMITPDDDLSGE